MNSSWPAPVHAFWSDGQRIRRNSLLVLLALALMPSNGLGIDLCPFHLLTGVVCPLCGLCRSMSSLLHGKFAVSLEYHPLGVAATAVLLYLAMFNQMPLVRRYTEKARIVAAAGIVVAVWLGRFL